ncbi:hypothetical protein [Pseudonocardia sp.]|uniref:hypothetical protein n=1 Tax=Pseudonocardia sp. TaxID=60912 RepID=UPI002F41786E
MAMLALRTHLITDLIAGSTGPHPSPAPSRAPNLPQADGSMVSQFFVWFYLIVGALLALAVVSGFLSYLIGEVKLHRECVRPLRDPPLAPPRMRVTRPGPVRPLGNTADQPHHLTEYRGGFTSSREYRNRS